MSVQTLIESKIESALQPSVLEVENESHMHSGPAAESHYRLVVVSEDFTGKKLLARHRIINKLLADELSGGVHALAMHTFTPEEWADRGETASPSPACRGGSAAESQS